MIHLVLGGARSGKSQYAETLASTAAELKSEQQAEQKENSVLYVATASADDNEMQERIHHHQQSRPIDWTLIEEKYALSKVLQEHNHPQSVLLIDCMTLWLTNWLCLKDENAEEGKEDENIKKWLEEKDRFLQSLIQFKGDVIIVSNEIGSGIIPLGELSRLFVDEAGRLNQDLAKLAHRVTLVIAGLPQTLKK